MISIHPDRIGRGIPHVENRRGEFGRKDEMRKRKQDRRGRNIETERQKKREKKRDESPR